MPRAAGLGFGPRYSPPEGDVLPLDDPAKFGSFRRGVEKGEEQRMGRERPRLEFRMKLRSEKERVRGRRYFHNFHQPAVG